MTAPSTVQITDLPAAIRAFLAAHGARQPETAIRALTPDAVVVDEGRTHRGKEQVLDFLRHAGTQFTYTTELVRAQRVDDQHWVVVHHLEGDFPGGVVDLRYRFTLEGDLVAGLVIAP